MKLFWRFRLFQKKSVFGSIFTPCFFEMLFWRVHPLVFPRPKQCKTPRKYSSFTTQFGSTHSYVNLCDDPLILKKMCFFGVFEGVVSAAIAAHTKASQPPKHPQTARKTVPRNGSWNFGLRVARGKRPNGCGAKAPCRRAPFDTSTFNS